MSISHPSVDASTSQIKHDADKMHETLDSIYNNNMANLANEFLQYFYDDKLNTDKHREKLATASAQLFLANHNLQKAVHAMGSFYSIMCVEEIQRHHDAPHVLSINSNHENNKGCDKMKRIIECPYKDFLKIYKEDVAFYENAIKKRKPNTVNGDAIAP
jgi:hypothetical protein